MISLAEKVNDEVETNTTHVDEAVTTANGASQKATKASEDVQKAITEANTTLQVANAAKVSAQASATASAGSASAAAGSASAASGSAADAAASAKAAEDIAAGMGGFDGTATSVKATDTQGIVVAAGADSNAQALLDALARKVALELVSNTALTTKLADYLKKTDIVQVESTATNKVPSSAYLKSVKDDINSNLEDLAGLKIERGIAETNVLSSGSSGYETVTIAFSQKFTAPPTISAIPATGIPTIMLSISNITVNGCTFWSNRKDGNATTIHWSAVGK